MAYFPAILAFSTHGWTSISCTVFVSTPETATEFEFELVLVCRWYLALGVVLALICTGAVWSVQALAGIWFLLSPHRVYNPTLVSLCNCLHLCLCAFLCFSQVINLLKKLVEECPLEMASFLTLSDFSPNTNVSRRVSSLIAGP